MMTSRLISIWFFLCTFQCATAEQLFDLSFQGDSVDVEEGSIVVKLAPAGLNGSPIVGGNDLDRTGPGSPYFRYDIGRQGLSILNTPFDLSLGQQFPDAPISAGRPADCVILSTGGLFVGATPGTVDPNTEDVYLYDLGQDNGTLVPRFNQESQFGGKIVSADSDGERLALLGTLSSGVFRNNILARFVNTGAGIEFQFSPPRQINQAPDFQIDGFVIGTGIDQSFKSRKGGSAPTYVFVWSSFGSDGDDNSLRSIQARLVDGNGLPVGDQFQVNTFTNGDQGSARVAAGPAGFVAVWGSEGSPGDDNSLGSIQARLYDSSGIARGDQFQVNQSIMGGQGQPAVAMGADGSFTVTWTDRPLNVSNVAARHFAPNGIPEGDQFQLNSEPGADSSAIDISGNDMVIAWRQGNVLAGVASFEEVFANGFEAISP